MKLLNVCSFTKNLEFFEIYLNEVNNYYVLMHSLAEKRVRYLKNFDKACDEVNELSDSEDSTGI